MAPGGLFSVNSLAMEDQICHVTKFLKVIFVFFHPLKR